MLIYIFIMLYNFNLFKQNIEHLSWIGLSKEVNGTHHRISSSSSHTKSSIPSLGSVNNTCSGSTGVQQQKTLLTTNNNWKKQVSPHHKHEQECEKVFTNFHHLRWVWKAYSSNYGCCECYFMTLWVYLTCTLVRVYHKRKIHWDLC